MKSEPELPSGSFDFERYIEFGGVKWLVDREFITTQQLTTYMQEGIQTANAKLMEVKLTDSETHAMQYNIADALAKISLVFSLYQSDLHPIETCHAAVSEQTVDSRLPIDAAVSNLRAVEQTVDSRLREAASRKKTLQCYWLFLCVTITGVLIGLGKMLSHSERGVEVGAMFFITSSLIVFLKMFGEEIFFVNKYNATKEELSGFTRLKRIITVTVFSVEAALVQQTVTVFNVEAALVQQRMVGQIKTKPLAAAAAASPIQILVVN